MLEKWLRKKGISITYDPWLVAVTVFLLMDDDDEVESRPRKAVFINRKQE